MQIGTVEVEGKRIAIIVAVGTRGNHYATLFLWFKLLRSLGFFLRSYLNKISGTRRA